jgi:hypothetical protein
LLRTLGVPVPGTVVNGLTSRQFGDGYAHGRYGYGYGRDGATNGDTAGPAHGENGTHARDVRTSPGPERRIGLARGMPEPPGQQ